MEEQRMEKIYRISRIILAVLSFIIFTILFIFEDNSWRIVPLIFALITFGISFPSTIISKKLMNLTDKIKSKVLKVLFYLIFLPVMIGMFSLAFYMIILFVFEMLPTSNELGEAIGQALFALFIVIVGVIGLVVPYIQTILVYILKLFIKEK